MSTVEHIKLYQVCLDKNAIQIQEARMEEFRSSFKSVPASSSRVNINEIFGIDFNKRSTETFICE